MWDEKSVRSLLHDVTRGKRSIDEATAQLCSMPAVENLGFARLDNHRSLRQGFSEVIYCAGKTSQQVAEIAARLVERHGRVLGTRATREQFDAAATAVPGLKYHEQARAIFFEREPREKDHGVVLVAAGTADLPVAEEAALTLEMMGHAPRRVFDVGVAGLHRLLGELPAIQSANVIVAVAGMEGALPSVVGGLVSCPVIAVPTSVGYGTGMGGIAALLAMLNSCASGLAVVNIDNGFGAACIAARINALAHRKEDAHAETQRRRVES
jgi:NCAIR mutase (PurE)-related protein